LLGGQC